LPPSNRASAPPQSLTIIGSFPTEAMTIKQMIDNALRDHFRKGATPIELREYFWIAYGRNIDRNSISPQLARLREGGRVIPVGGKWKLTAAGLVYDHPTSWNAADEPAAQSDQE
jgi:hypothetical protein